jgi:hypothetical protein
MQIMFHPANIKRLMDSQETLLWTGDSIFGVGKNQVISVTQKEKRTPRRSCPGVLFSFYVFISDARVLPSMLDSNGNYDLTIQSIRRAQRN